MEKTRVENMLGRTGRKIANQKKLFTEKGVYFQSYDTIIAFKPLQGKVQLDIYMWDYSRTTGKYRNQFLGEKKEATVGKIERGEYELIDLNPLGGRRND